MTEYPSDDAILLQPGSVGCCKAFDEYHDASPCQILSVFPTFVLQQIQNATPVRQIVPRAIDRPT